MAPIAARRPSSLVPVGVIAASAVLSGCGGESNTVQIHAEVERGSDFTVGVFTADGAGFCPTGTVVPTRWEPAEETDGRQTFSQNQYKCDDGSGFFLIEMILDIPFDVADDPPGGPLGSEIGWSLGPGLGDYADTSGSGEGTAEFDSGRTVEFDGGGFYVFDGTLSTD